MGVVGTFENNTLRQRIMGQPVEQFIGAKRHAQDMFTFIDGLTASIHVAVTNQVEHTVIHQSTVKTKVINLTQIRKDSCRYSAYARLQTVAVFDQGGDQLANLS